MGLDMYLTKKTYVGAEYKHRKVTGKVDVKVDGVKLPIQFNRISEICERVGYWRKANQIHGWFVENVQDGIDECQESEVEYEHLAQLAADCEAVLKEPATAEGVLPTMPGCFFGGQEYDEYYLQDLKDTLEIINPLLAEAEIGSSGNKYFPESIYYRASW